MPRVRRLRPWGFTAFLAATLCLGAPGQAAAQTGCRFGPGSGTANIDEIPGGGRISRLGHPHFVCDDGVQIWADSAESFSAQNMSHLMGHVRYVDSTRVLSADDARYFSRVGRLQAFGHLFVRDTARGSVIQNGSLVYLRKSATREQEEMTVVTGPDKVRPRARLYMRPAADTAGTAGTAAEGAAPGPGVRPDSTRSVADTARAAQRDTALAQPADTAKRGPADTAKAAPPDTAKAAPPDTTHALSPETAKAAPRDTTHALPPRGDTAAPAPPVPEGRPPGVSPARDTTPYIVDADRLVLRGGSDFLATGSVDITRDSLRAFADTAQYEQEAGRLALNGRAWVRSSGYDLSGKTVNIAVPGGQITQVRAVHDANLTGNQLTMNAPVITVFMTDGQMDRLVATPLPRQQADSAEQSPAAGLRPGLLGVLSDSAASAPAAGKGPQPSRDAVRRPDVLHVLAGSAGRTPTVPDSADLARPVAFSAKFHITADSLDVRAPAQVLDKMYAVGNALGKSSAGDSLDVPSLSEVARKDWIAGDTVIASFVKVEPKADQPHDSVHYDLDRLVARGNASSLYRMAPSDSAFRPGIDPPAVHYVRGTDITIVLDSGQVDHMEVVDPRGWHLEPLTRAARDSLAADSAQAADSARAHADTTRAPAGKLKPPADTTKAQPDTLKVRRDTMRIRRDTMTAPDDIRAVGPHGTDPGGGDRSLPADRRTATGARAVPGRWDRERRRRRR
jgi:lipopolysaccharide export system protein LptA